MEHATPETVPGNGETPYDEELAQGDRADPELAGPSGRATGPGEDRQS